MIRSFPGCGGWGAGEMPLPARRKPGGEQFAYYCWAVGLGSLVAGIVKFGILA